MSRHGVRKNPSLSLCFYLDLMEYIKESSKTTTAPFPNVEEIVTKYENDQSQKTVLLEMTWAILSKWGELNRFRNVFDLFKNAVIKDWKGFVEGMNSALIVAGLPANNEERKYTLRVVNNLQVFDLSKCSVHIKKLFIYLLC